MYRNTSYKKRHTNKFFKRTIGFKMIKKWIDMRMKERTSWDGAALIVLGLMVLFLAPIAKIAAGLAIAYGAWTIWKSE